MAFMGHRSDSFKVNSSVFNSHKCLSHFMNFSTKQQNRQVVHSSGIKLIDERTNGLV